MATKIARKLAATAGMGMLVAGPAAALIVNETEPNDEPDFSDASIVDFAAGEDQGWGFYGEPTATGDLLDHWKFINLPAGDNAEITVATFNMIPTVIFDFLIFDGDDLINPLATLTIDDDDGDSTFPRTDSFAGTIPPGGVFAVRVENNVNSPADATEAYSIELRATPASAPLPATAGLFSAGLITLAALRRRQKRPPQAA